VVDFAHEKDKKEQQQEAENECQRKESCGGQVQALGKESAGEGQGFAEEICWKKQAREQGSQFGKNLNEEKSTG
jgi:hypothetical protein